MRAFSGSLLPMRSVRSQGGHVQLRSCRVGNSLGRTTIFSSQTSSSRSRNDLQEGSATSAKLTNFPVSRAHSGTSAKGLERRAWHETELLRGLIESTFGRNTKYLQIIPILEPHVVSHTEMDVQSTVSQLKNQWEQMSVAPPPSRSGSKFCSGKDNGKCSDSSISIDDNYAPQYHPHRNCRGASSEDRQARLRHYQRPNCSNTNSTATTTTTKSGKSFSKEGSFQRQGAS